jgi:hypothetical protein
MPQSPATPNIAKGATLPRRNIMNRRLAFDQMAHTDSRVPLGCLGMRDHQSNPGRMRAFRWLLPQA